MVGYKYIVKFVAINRILKAEKLNFPPCKDSYHYLKYILKEEYNITEIEFPQIREVLEEEGIRQDCYKKHKALLSKFI